MDPRPGGPEGQKSLAAQARPQAPARLRCVEKLPQLRRRGGRKRLRRSGPLRAERCSGRSCFCRGRERETRARESAALTASSPARRRARARALPARPARWRQTR